MRPLKFRIWDGNNKHYVYPDVLELNAGLEYQQFTGLLDKQGKKIYEGDFVSDGINPPFEVLWDYPLLARVAEIKVEIVGNKWQR